MGLAFRAPGSPHPDPNPDPRRCRVSTQCWHVSRTLYSTVQNTAVYSLLRKAVRSELRKTELYSEMLFEFAIGVKDFKANAASGLIGKLDMQDKGSEGDADVEEEDVRAIRRRGSGLGRGKRVNAGRMVYVAKII